MHLYYKEKKTQKKIRKLNIKLKTKQTQKINIYFIYFILFFILAINTQTKKRHTQLQNFKISKQNVITALSRLKQVI